MLWHNSFYYFITEEILKCFLLVKIGKQEEIILFKSACMLIDWKLFACTVIIKMFSKTVRLAKYTSRV